MHSNRAPQGSAGSRSGSTSGAARHTPGTSRSRATAAPYPSRIPSRSASSGSAHTIDRQPSSSRSPFPMTAWNEAIPVLPITPAPPVPTHAAPNELTRPPKDAVWRGKDGSIWSSPSIAFWPPDVPATGPPRDVPIDDWEKSSQTYLLSEEANIRHRITWWSPERPYLAFYPRKPLTDREGALKSLARFKTAEESVEQNKHGMWVPVHSYRWVNLSFMLHMIAGILFFAYGRSGRFPVRQWKPYPVGWWNDWTSDRATAIEVARIQLHHLVAFCASLSYICAIARFETGEPEAWYHRLRRHALNNSVLQWCEQFRHTWVPMMQVIPRVGTFFDARDIKWADIIQLYHDSGIPFIIYWGKTLDEAANVGLGIIPDKFRPSAKQILSAPHPPDCTALLGPSPSMPVPPVTLGTVNLSPLRDYFQKHRPSFEAKQHGPQAAQNKARGKEWQITQKNDSGIVWEINEETGVLERSRQFAKQCQQLLEDDEQPWLICYDYTARVWHWFPIGTFPDPELVTLRGVDIMGLHDLSDRDWWMRTRCPNMEKADWDHLTTIQNLAVNLLSTRQVDPIKEVNPLLRAAVREMEVQCELGVNNSDNAVMEPPTTPVDDEDTVPPPSSVQITSVGTGPSSSAPEDESGLSLPRVYGSDASQSLLLSDWTKDAQCGPRGYIRVPSPQTCLDRAGFIMTNDDELVKFSRTPPMAPKSTKGTPPLQFSLLSLGAWTSVLSTMRQDWRSMTPAMERALQMGRSRAVCQSIPDFVTRLSELSLAPPPNPQDGRPDYSQLPPQLWMYSPSTEDLAWSLIGRGNKWRVADGTVQRLVTRANSFREIVPHPVWILTHNDNQLQKSVVLHHASVVVQVLRDGTQFATGEDILEYCAQSTIRVNEAAISRPAADSVRSPESVRNRAQRRAFEKSKRALGYKELDYVVSPYDFADYEEACRLLFTDLAIWLAAIKAGGILARIAMAYRPPEDILLGPHADAVELGLGLKIWCSGQQEFVDDRLTPELELFIVGGFWQIVNPQCPNLDHARTFFPRAETWDHVFGSPGWDYEKEAIYQQLRNGYLRPKEIGSHHSKFQPLSGNKWTDYLWWKAPFTRKCALVIEAHARRFLSSRSKHEYCV